MTSAGVRSTVLQEIRPGAGFKTGDFVEEKLGGATVQRLGRGLALVEPKKGIPCWLASSSEELPVSVEQFYEYDLV